MGYNPNHGTGGDADDRQGNKPAVVTRRAFFNCRRARFQRMNSVALNQVEVGCTYQMDDGRKLRLTREWTSEDSHTRVRFEVIEGSKTGFLDCSKDEFLSKAGRQI